MSTMMAGAGKFLAGEQYAAQTVGDYLSLITSEYQPCTKMMAWLSANLQLYSDLAQCALAIPAAFDISLASGVQLDILGGIVGQSRVMPFQPSDDVSPILDDATYRLLIQARAFQNHWDGSIGSLFTIWRSLFPGGILLITDNEDMTISLYVAGAFTSIIKDLISKGFILPRPEGVLYNFTFATLPIFGFDRDDAYIGPFDTGHFV